MKYQCPMCGHEDCSAVYRQSIDGKAEALRHDCTRCGYSWQGKTLQQMTQYDGLLKFIIFFVWAALFIALLIKQ